MKSFKDYVNENESPKPIKLRGFGPSPSQYNFLQDFHDSTQPHPFDDSSRIINGNSTVHISRSQGGIHIHDIRSLAPRSGAGTDAIEYLKSLADKHGVKLTGIAKAYSGDKKYITKTSQLKKFYQKRGFEIGDGDEHEGYDITYHPKKD